MLSKEPKYIAVQPKQLDENNIDRKSENVKLMKSRIEGDGIYNNLPTILPQSRPYFNYRHEEMTTKPNNYIDKVIKERDITQTNNHYDASLNKARSMGNYLTPFSFSCFSDKKSIPTKLSYKDEYRLKEINDGILKSFLSYHRFDPNNPNNKDNPIFQSQQLPSSKELKHSASCKMYSNSFVTNYTTGILSLGKEEGQNKENEKTRHTIIPSLFPDNNPPMYIKKTLNDKFHSVLSLSSIPEYSFRQYHNEKYNMGFYQREISVDKLSDMPYEGLFGLFDGHNDSSIVDYCKDHFPFVFKRQLDNNPQTVYPYENMGNKANDRISLKKTKRGLRTSTETLLVKSFLKLDEEIKYSNQPESGCCACIVYITKELEKISEVSTIRKYLYCANIGDIQCLLLTRNSVKHISTLHDTDNGLEIKRLRETGGVLYQDKVFGQYQFTRAFGHFNLKSYGITSIPDVKKYLIDSFRDKYIVIGTKGVFEHLKAEDILYFSQGIIKTEDIVNKIINNALMSGTRDNLSCFVLKI